MNRRARSTAGLALACVLAGCGGGDRSERELAEGPGGLRVAIEDVAAPDIAEREGDFAVDAGAEGLWVALPGLARAERGRVTAPGTGRSVVAALFPAGAAGASVSSDLAAALGVAGDRARLAVVALRQEARILP